MNVSFCDCESNVATLTKLRYWPATPSRPSIAFSFSLLDWLQALLLQCQVPVCDFASALELMICTTCDKMPCSIYPALIESFEEYRSLKGQVDQLQGICDIQRFASCPACPKDDGTVLTLSIDANFGLCRKKSAGKSVHDPKTANHMFVDQAKVDRYVQSYATDSKDSRADKACNNFLAGHMLRSKSRYSALDETAVMGAACRHECPVPRFFSLKHGERIAYSVHLCEQLRQLYPNLKVQLMYDIACNLDRHLKANSRSDILDHFEFAVPVFHAYGHESACQMKYNPRNIVGFGLSDGEVVERVWSYLRRFSSMTKEMHPSHRIDILSDALSYYCQKSSHNLCKLLPKRLVHARKVKQESIQQLHELLDDSAEPVRGQIVAQWADDEKIELGASHRPEQEEEQLQSLARERWFLLRLKSKYAAGQSIAIRLSRRINVVTKQLKSKLERFNAKQPPTGKITWDEVTQLDANQPSTVPRSTKYQAVRLFHKAARANEEEFRIISEMRNTIHHYLCKLEVITSAVSDIDQNDEVTQFQSGACALLLMKRNQCVLALARLDPFLSYGDFPELSQFCAGLQYETVNPDCEETQHDCSISNEESYMPQEAKSDSSMCNSDLEEVDLESMAGDTTEAESSESDDFFDCSDQEGNDCCHSPTRRAHQLSKPPCTQAAGSSIMSNPGHCSHKVCLTTDSTRSTVSETVKPSDLTVTQQSSSSEDDMEVQHWRGNRFLREEFIRSTMKPIELDDEQQQILSKISKAK